MKNSSKNYVLVTLFIAALTMLPMAGQAQSIWFDNPDHTSRVGIEFLIPSFDGFNTQGAAFAPYIYSYLPVSDKFAIQLDLPVSHFSNGGGEANFAIGNPYIGFKYSGTANTTWDFGVRTPVVNDFENALVSGFATENYRVGAFVTDSYTLVSNINYRSSNFSGFNFRIGGGLEGLIPTEGGGGALFAKYYGQVLYPINKFTFGGGINARVFLSESGFSFSERAIHNVALSGSYDLGRWDVGAYVERSLDEGITNGLTFVLGLNLSVGF